jgi:hypothetical protein
MVKKFSVPCYVHVGDVGKLDAKAGEAVFMGVDAQSKAFWVYWPGVISHILALLIRSSGCQI